MHGPATVGWLLAALCALTGVSCVLRARGTDREGRADAGGEALMGFGMAVMAVPLVWTGQPLPPAVTAAAFAVVFGALLVRELWVCATRRHAVAGGHLHHVLGAGAMLYMALGMLAATPGGGTGHAGHGAAGTGAGVPLLTGALLAYFAGYVLWTGARLMPGGAGAAVAGGPGNGPGPVGVVHQAGVAAGCRLAMGTGMFAMLLTM